MKVLAARSKFLTKREVLDIVESSGCSGSDQEETIKYLVKEYCRDALPPSNVGERLAAMGLFPFEVYQLINAPPRTLLALQLVIDEMEERYTHGELEDILKLFSEGGQ